MDWVGIGGLYMDWSGIFIGVADWSKGRSPPKKNVYFWTLLKLAPPPYKSFLFFLDVKKQRIARMTEKSTDGNDDG